MSDYLVILLIVEFCLTTVSLVSLTMLNKGNMQSGAAAVEKTDPPEHSVPSTTPEETIKSSHEADPGYDPNFQEVESRELEPAQIDTATASAIAEEEAQPCLETRSSVIRRSHEKTTASPELARGIAKNLGSSTLAFATGLLPIYFLIFAALAFKNNNAVLEPNSQAEWLPTAAKYVCFSTHRLET